MAVKGITPKQTSDPGSSACTFCHKQVLLLHMLFLKKGAGNSPQHAFKAKKCLRNTVTRIFLKMLKSLIPEIYNK